MTTGDNKEVIVPNGAIYGGNIINYSAKETRRVDMVVGIGYSSDLLKAKKILQELVDADERILKDPAVTIAVSELAESSVNFVLRPWVKTADFWAVKFALTEAIKLRFDQEGIQIPYPQMDVHVHKTEE
jgi:small conductance mechanosensitive channel